MDILGYRPEELLGKTPFDLMPAKELKKIRGVFEHAIAQKSPIIALENINLSKDGQEVILETSGQPFFSTSGKLLGYRGVDRDITQRKKAEEKLKYMATHDALTGLYNRKVLDKLIIDEVGRSERYGHPISIFMLDIDHFKQINDTYGHQTGDTVLQNIASIMVNSIRKMDYAARYGGEEFIIVLPETSLAEAEEMAERLCFSIAEHSFLTKDDKKLNITASIGVATFPEHAQSWKDLIHAADNAMYAAKKAGRNQVQIKLHHRG